MSGISLGNGKAVAQTAAALRVKLESESLTRWIPKSVIHDDSEVYQINDEGKVVVAQWWSDQNGFSDAGKVRR